MSPASPLDKSTWERHLEKLRRIWLGQEKHGEGPRVVQARRYYLQYMFEEVVQRARQRSFPDQPPPQVYLLISLVGFSPETTLLTFELLKPQRLMVIGNIETEEAINAFGECLIETCKLPLSHYERYNVDTRNPDSIFQVIEQRLAHADVQEHRQKLLRNPSQERQFIPVVIDITGGKKVMGAIAALAAWEFDAVPCYVDGDEYDQEMRRPVPGSERLLILRRAIDLFGGKEFETAVRLYQAGAFEAAYEHFSRLAEHVVYPQRARLYRDVSALYSAWCTLDMPKLAELVRQIREQVNQAQLPIQHARSRALRDQLEFLNRVIDQDRDALVLNLFLLGKHYQQIGRYDFAALLFYRTIEGCLIRQIEKRNPSFHPRRPDYSLLGNPTDLLRRYQQITQQLDPNFCVQALPHRISLMDAAVLLCALEDELARQASLDRPESLKNLLGLTEIRNQSVLAHGYKSVSHDDCAELQKRAFHILSTYWKITYPEEDLDALLHRLAFLTRLED